MILFYCITALMIGIAILFLTPALLRKKSDNEVKESLDKHNITIAREHLADLDEELANRTLTQDLYDQSRLEIEQTLTFDLESPSPAIPKKPAVRFTMISLVGTSLFIVIVTFILYLQLGVPELIEPYVEDEAEHASHSGPPPSMDDLIKKLATHLEQNPDDANGWFLMGRTLIGYKQYQAALEAFENTRKIVGDDEIIRKAITEVRALIENKTVPSSKTMPTASLTVTVKLADHLTNKVQGNETIFIYAKALQGPPFPVAAARYQVKDLPLTLTLDDTNAIMPVAKLSDFKTVKLSARVSYSGDAITQSGDLLGNIDNVLVGGKAITIIINTIAD